MRMGADDKSSERGAVTPCPACHGKGLERHCTYDARGGVVQETIQVCPLCHGAGRATPRIEIAPGHAPTSWAWEIGDLA